MIPARIRQWWPDLVKAADDAKIDAYFLAAVVDRESLGGVALTPSGPTGTGDDGNGLGLCQVDRRFHPEFFASGEWTDPAKNLAYGARLLAAELARFEAAIPLCYLADRDERQAAIMGCASAAYNAGPVRILRALEQLTKPTSLEAILDAADTHTTKGDYGQDVLVRRLRFLAPPPTNQPPPLKP